jgi:hypothetical protein
VEGLTCAICMDLILSCRISVCGHAFCHQCIQECLVRRKECPQCRKNIRRKALHLSRPLDNAVKMIVQAKRDAGETAEYEKWEERVKHYNEWLAKHEVGPIKAGD